MDVAALLGALFDVVLAVFIIATMSSAAFTTTCFAPMMHPTMPDRVPA